jgi:hypothetical protein
VGDNIGVLIRHLTHGTSSNLGIVNESGTAEPPLEVELDAAGDALPITASLLVLDNTTAATLTLTSTPTIPDGYPGQRIVVYNPSADMVNFQAEAVLTGSNIASRVQLDTGQVTTFRWDDDSSVWINERGPVSLFTFDGPGGSGIIDTETPHGVGNAPAFRLTKAGDTHPSVSMGYFFGFPAFTFGSGTADPDVLAYRSAALEMTISGAVRTNVAKAANAQTGTAYTVVVGDAPKMITRSNAAASTMTFPSNATAAIPIGTQIPVMNLGAGTVTYAAGSGATIAGAATLTTGQRHDAVKITTNGWFIA